MEFILSMVSVTKRESIKFCQNTFRTAGVITLNQLIPSSYKGENLRHDHLCFKRK